MSTMNPIKRQAIAYSYIASQFQSAAYAFAGSLFTFYDYNNPEGRGEEPIGIYLLNFSIAIFSGTIAATIAKKFQGQKIGKNEDYSGINLYHYEDAPRSWKSNLAEIAFIGFATLMSLVNNYFLLAAIKGTSATLKDPNNEYPILPLHGTGGVFLFIKTFLFDAYFDMSNSLYETAEDIKEEITGSKDGPWISLLFKPLIRGKRYNSLLFWIKTGGVFSHTLTDYLSLVLSVPPRWLTKLYENIAVFVIVMLVSTLASIPLISVNLIQTLYFEAAESEINLSRLQYKDSDMEHLPTLWEERKKTSFLQRLLLWKPSLKSPIRKGFYTQGPLHAFGDFLPSLLFIQDISDRVNADFTVTIPLVVILAGTTFFGSCFGTHYSEVTTAIKHYDKDFEDIQNKSTTEITPLQDIPNLGV